MPENLSVSLNAVLPLFFIMAAGYGVRRAGLIGEELISRFNSVAFATFMPCLLFSSIYTSDLSRTVRPQLILFAVAAVLLVYAACVLLVRAAEKTPDRRGVMIQGLFRSNYMVIGLPIAMALSGGGDLGTVALLIAILIPIYNVLAVITLEAYCGRRVKAGETLLSILKNPLIISTALGVLVKLLRLELPAALFSAVESLGRAATPLQLLLLGAFFRFSGMRRYARGLTAAALGRLVVIPGIVLFIALALGFRGMEFVALLGCFAAPAAISSFVMTQQMGGDAELAGDIVVLTSALSPATIFLWAFLFRTLGAY